MAKPVKGLLSRLRKQAEPEPEPELAPDRLAALRHRAAVAEDPELGELDEVMDSADFRQGRGLQPVVLVRSQRVAGGDIGPSWLGGLPKLGAIPWPRGADGLPLPFAAQIELAEIAEVRPDNPLPSSGTLAFFLGEGAVVHVPAGVTQFTSTPDDLAAAPYPLWPVEPFALTLPPTLRDPSDPERHGDIREAMEAAITAELPRAGQPFDPATLSEEDWGGPIPLWWHGVEHLIDHLRLALGASGTNGQRDGLAALTGALAGFAAERNPWDMLSAEEHEVFAEALANVRQQFGGLLDATAPQTVAEVSAVSLRAMIAGDDRALAALPAPVRELIDSDYRLPVTGQPQLLGLGMATEALAGHLGDVLLLQIAGDDLLEWGMAEGEARQFWIAPDALAERRWAATVLA